MGVEPLDGAVDLPGAAHADPPEEAGHEHRPRRTLCNPPPRGRQEGMLQLGMSPYAWLKVRGRGW